MAFGPHLSAANSKGKRLMIFQRLNVLDPNVKYHLSGK